MDDHVDGEQQEAVLEASDKKGDHDFMDVQSPKSRKATMA